MAGVVDRLTWGDDMHFEWDEDKARRNKVKHGVSFEEAKKVFLDPLYVDFFDPEHSASERRYLRIGVSEADRVLLVSYTERDQAIRIISARKATNRERGFYEQP